MQAIPASDRQDKAGVNDPREYAPGHDTPNQLDIPKLLRVTNLCISHF